ncbi:hypothetical protein L6452_27345 [Arctium lappa]|uniref:Uncharacterized protein n=1 Tax=Arctium lappa TaxID=4217 RepID=A0ACB8ZW78_ARCLA|nr:hypothetical protein L6452_27345 [Arctium lappa]
MQDHHHSEFRNTLLRPSRRPIIQRILFPEEMQSRDLLTIPTADTKQGHNSVSTLIDSSLLVIDAKRPQLLLLEGNIDGEVGETIEKKQICHLIPKFRHTLTDWTTVKVDYNGVARAVPRLEP